MFSSLRFVLRFTLLVLWVILGLVSVLFIFPLAGSRLRIPVNRLWSRVLLVICGVRVTHRGTPRMHGPVMWVANHVSWVDIFVLNSVRPAAFVAKSEIRRWPLLGWLARGAGTVFIERGRRHAVSRISAILRSRFENNEAVGLFPEGTTSAGLDVGPFHASLLEAAIQANADIQPIALRFFYQGIRSDFLSFVGEQNLLQNLWRLLGARDARVEVVFLQVLSSEQCRQSGRAKIAAHAHHAIRQAVVKPGEQAAP